MDTLLVCALVGILVAIVFYYYERVVLEAKEVAMKAELQNIRTAINAYRALHDNRKPKSLKGLVSEKYLVSKNEKNPMERKYVKQAMLFDRHYLEVYSIDKEGYPIDSFGNRYRYNPETGDVISGTGGYESW